MCTICGNGGIRLFGWKTVGYDDVEKISKKNAKKNLSVLKEVVLLHPVKNGILLTWFIVKL